MMKKLICAVSLTAGLCLAGCAQTTVEHAAGGATVGAVSASFVGAVTDLIVDGKVNSYRLSRNMVGGAVAGGVAGGVAGHKKAKAEEAARAKQEQQVPSGLAELEQTVGSDNMRSLQNLLH